MCGADDCARNSRFIKYGSPPRVRSRPLRTERAARRQGITSACAEQTAWVKNVGTWQKGSPPRVRSRHAAGRLRRGLDGITSACAEQTLTQRVDVDNAQDHLRVCGADADCAHWWTWLAGSPPRVRSRPVAAVCEVIGLGITSACAEQTVVFYCVLSQLNGVEYLIYALRRVS